jgi:hypothetical protein
VLVFIFHRKNPVIQIVAPGSTPGWNRKQWLHVFTSSIELAELSKHPDFLKGLLARQREN